MSFALGSGRERRRLPGQRGRKKDSPGRHGSGRSGDEFRDQMALDARKLSTLYRLTRLLAGGADGASLLRAVVREALSLTGGRGGQILVQRDGRTLHRLIGEGEADGGEGEISADISPWGDALRLGRAAWLPAMAGHEAQPPVADAITLALPLLARGDVLGLLALWGVPGIWARPHCEPFLEALADVSAHALHNASLYRDLLRQKKELYTLVEVGRDIAASLDLDEVLRRVVRHAARLLHVQASSLMLVDEAGATLHARATYGMGHGRLQGLSLNIATSDIGEVVRTGSPLAILDVRQRLHDRFMRLVHREGLRSLLCMPLKTGVRLLGLLVVYTTAPRRFREDEVELLAALAAHSATAVENARLHRAMLDAQERLRQSERLAALGHMSAGLAHEVRNPLHTMQLLTDAMHKDCPPASPWHADLEVIQNEIARLTLLLDRFLDFARPKPPEVKPQKLHEIMEETLLLVGAEARRRRIHLHKKWRRDLPLVGVDGEQLKQVFLNILLNALQATPPGGSIAIAIDADATTITAEIQDQGAGIPPAVQAQLFTPFLTTKPKGVGLGLSIARRIVESHRGTISVTSHLGEGTAVSIALPLAPEQTHEQDLPRRR
jgi:two-component system sensor histidine kinase HydH